MPLIDLTLDFDGLKALEQLQSAVSLILITVNMSILVKIDWLDRKTPQETELFGLWRQNVAAQQICLENLANICSLVESNDGLLSSALLLI